MLLSRLEISGFKSFPNKTVIDFDGGITGVVGPNGCGKSNILDSIRWVLGEQRTSVLRSSRMEEVIFSGTSQLKPIGMAEVTLYIKNNRGLLPIEYDDLSITRRLYRSGESEYLLNKNQCRLKDIVELFL
ncbi:MAG: AAA family ATPase, partial [candidate division Zixibacteria bacterium]